MLPACWLQFKLSRVVELGLLSFAPKLENISLYSQPSWSPASCRIDRQPCFQELTVCAPHSLPVPAHLSLAHWMQSCSPPHHLSTCTNSLPKLFDNQFPHFLQIFAKKSRSQFSSPYSLLTPNPIYPAFTLSSSYHFPIYNYYLFSVSSQLE